MKPHEDATRFPIAIHGDAQGVMGTPWDAVGAPWGVPGDSMGIALTRSHSQGFVRY